MSVAEGEPITVVVADGHPFYLRGLADAIASAPAMALVGTAVDGDTALALIGLHHPDVAVIDVELPGLDAQRVVQAARHAGLPTRILLLAERQFGERVLQSLTAGAAGFISKTAPESGFFDAICRAAAGRSVLPDDIGSLLATTLRQHGEAEHSPLTAREHQILQLIADGNSAAEMAAQLQLAVPTVKSHIQNLYGKLGAHDRGSAVATAIRRGVVQ